MKKKPKLTPWFDAWTEKPVRPGPYEVDSNGDNRTLYRNWDGKHWCYGRYTPKEAEEYATNRNNRIRIRHSFCWRGLAEDQSK